MHVTPECAASAELPRGEGSGLTYASDKWTAVRRVEINQLNTETRSRRKAGGKIRNRMEPYGGNRHIIVYRGENMSSFDSNPNET